MADEESVSARISLLLGLARAGDPEAFQQVFEAAYPELRALARARLAPGPTVAWGAPLARQHGGASLVDGYQ